MENKQVTAEEIVNIYKDVPADKKKELVDGFIQLVTKESLRLFMMLDLKTHIEAGVVNHADGKKYIFSFTTEEYATLKTRPYKKQIAELQAKLADERRKNTAMAQGLLPREYTGQVAQLTAENERLREAYKKTADGYSRLRWASKDAREEMYNRLLKAAGINLTP